MLDRQGGEIVFECDLCGEVFFTGESDFSEALIALRGDGWIARREGKDWMHYCATCKS